MKSIGQNTVIKKTNINDLCQISGISKGSFYNFFDSKEALFYEVIISAHNKLVKITEDGLKKMYD